MPYDTEDWCRELGYSASDRTKRNKIIKLVSYSNGRWVQVCNDDDDDDDVYNLWRHEIPRNAGITV